MSSSTIAVAKSDLSSTALQGVATFSVTPSLVSTPQQLTLTGSTADQGPPYATVYLAPDGSGDLQAWELPLNNVATVPAPIQIGSLSQPYSSTAVCGTKAAARDLFQPATSFFIVLYTVQNNSCASGASVLINLSDSNGTTPTPVPIAQSSFGDMYLSSGQLYGLVGADPGTGNLNLYPASNGVLNFSAPNTLISGVSTASYTSITLSRSKQIADTVLYAQVTFSGSPAPASQIIRVDTSGRATPVYTVSGTLVSAPIHSTLNGTASPDGMNRDDTNVYFVDAVTTSGSTTYNFYGAPIAGGSAFLIAAITPPSGTSYSITDSDGATLIVAANTNGAFTSTLYTLSVTGLSSQVPAQLISSSQDAALDYASGELFVTVHMTGVNADTGVVLKPSGSSPSTPLAGPLSPAAFENIWNAGFDQGGTWLEYSGGMTDGTFAGAVMDLVPTGNLAQSTSFTCPSCGSGSYIIPAAAGAQIEQLTNNVGVGLLGFASHTPQEALLLNLQMAQLQVFSLAFAGGVRPFY